MTEEPKQTPPEEPKQTPPEEPKTEPNMIVSAKEQADRLKAENDRMAEHIKQLQEIKATDLLSGTTNAGQTQKEVVDPAQTTADEIVNAFKR